MVIREIKFRVWHKDSKTWKHKFVEKSHDHIPMCVYKDQEFFTIGWSKSDQHVVQLFTGLTDRNNNEIYEGDLVKCSFTNAAPVYWDVRTASFRFGSGWVFNFEGKEVEVIGNIFENKSI